MVSVDAPAGRDPHVVTLIDFGLVSGLVVPPEEARGEEKEGTEKGVGEGHRFVPGCSPPITNLAPLAPLNCLFAVGKVPYMAPEVYAGAGPYDARAADLWSFGVT